MTCLMTFVVNQQPLYIKARFETISFHKNPAETKRINEWYLFIFKSNGFEIGKSNFAKEKRKCYPILSKKR